MPEVVAFGRKAGRPPGPNAKPKAKKKPSKNTRSPKVGTMALATTGFTDDHGRRRSMPSPGPNDLRRWFKHEGLGKSVEQIAGEERHKVFVVQASLDYVKEWQFRNRLSVLEAKAISVAMDALDDTGKVLKDGMKAEKVVWVNQKTGRIKKAPDHATRLKSVGEVRSFIETVQPKAPAAQLNQQFNINGAGGMSGGMSFESVLRKKREQQGLANDQELEVITAEQSAGLTIDQEFADFGGDEEEEEDDEEGDE